MISHLFNFKNTVLTNMENIDDITDGPEDERQDLNQLRRFFYQIENIGDFSKDEAADQVTLIMMVEQCLGLRVGVNYEYVTVG
jgi:hypothetical protein